MHWKKGLFAFLLITAQPLFAAGLEENWNDFLHYTAIGRFDLAQGYAQAIIDSQPDPAALLALSEDNLQGYRILLKMNTDSDQLRQVSGRILELIEQGRFLRRTDPKIIVEDIRRLSSTIRGRIAAEEHLKNAGEYAIPFMLDAMSDEARRVELSNIIDALPKIGRDAIRPLTAAMQSRNVALKVEMVRALGQIGYFEPLPYLKLVVEKESSPQLAAAARLAVEQIDSSAMKIPAAELFYRLAEMYYDRAESVAPPAEYDFANIWFWDGEKNGLIRQQVDRRYFFELMAMRCCEWALEADASAGKAVGLWLAAFFRAEAPGIPMPEYFGQNHADAETYATTAGPEYLHQALERALRDRDGFVALGAVEALAVNAGQKSLLYQLGPEQPLVKAMDFEDRKVRYSAAVALALACPSESFTGSSRIVENLAEAIVSGGAEDIGPELAGKYALRAVASMQKLAVSGNKVIDMSKAVDALIKVTVSGDQQMRILAGQTLAYLSGPQAQVAIAKMAMSEENTPQLRIAAFESLALSAKMNANLLDGEQIDGIYSLVCSTQTNPALRSAAAGAFGALNLPSEKVRKLILDQARR